MGRFIDRLIGFSASLRLAVLVILALAAYLAVGTAYEARFGARAAGRMVYQSPVFVMILALLALNVLAAAVIRFPWKRHQTGFVITHAGILVLLAGCLIGQRWGVDGRLTLRVPGDGDGPTVARGDSIDLPDEQLAVFDATDRAIAVFPIELRRAAGYPTVLRFVLQPLWPVTIDGNAVSASLGSFQGVQVSATAWHPAVRVQDDGSIHPIRMKPAEIDSGIAAIRVRLAARGNDREVWVIRGEQPIEVNTPGGTIKLGYGFAARPLPFAVELIEARRSPRGLSARVRVLGEEYALAPNRPATVRGLTIYLSSIERVNDRIVAFMSVRRDPGWTVKYAGCALIVLGTAMMFVIRRPKAQAVLENPDVPPVRRLPEGRRRSHVKSPPVVAPATVALACLLGLGSPVRAGEGSDEALRLLPVQHDGRIKPMDTFARETVRQVRGRGTEDDLRTMLQWAIEPDVSAGKPWILVDNLELRRKLGIPVDQKWIAPAALRENEDFRRWAVELQERLSAGESAGELVELSKVERAAIEVGDRLSLFDSITPSYLRAILALDRPPGEDAWMAALRAAAGGKPFAGNDASLWPAVRGGQHGRAMAREVRYGRVHPFRWVGAAYAIALAALLSGRGRSIGLAALAIAVVLHAGAFVWRCSITGWAPVTNMYETVVWVGGISAMLGLILTWATSAPAAAIAGALVAALACVVGDVMPPEFGRSISTLAPVLQSNLWLTVHVLTVVSSYAAFAVALVLGNVALWRIAQQKPRNGGSRFDPQDAAPSGLPTPASNLLALIYRCIQVGVVLIAAGTVLGGVWADYAWGRFWGWDPKEVWALIVLLAYLALLHGRYIGWVGPFGLAAGAVVCFLTVLMSWYGVNFVLGAGLHSYGFGAGGLEYVLAYAIVQSAFVLWARWRYRLTAIPPTNSEARIDVEAPMTNAEAGI